MKTERTQRVLVTGATGFLGRNVLQALAARPDVAPIAACRRIENLPAGFAGEVRAGDLLDAAYRTAVVENVDVVCHAGTWAAFWGHASLERSRFLEPTIDLIEQSIQRGVRRFIQASSIAMSAPAKDHAPIDDFAPTRYTGFWPHLDRLIDVDRFMRENSGRGTQMVMMRLGHFVGAGNALGLVPALAPRLRARLVPWIAGGRHRMPLVADSDLGEAFALAAVARGLKDYESFNICGPEVPTSREVIEFIASETGFPKPWFSVSSSAGYAFGWLMEMLHPILPGSSPLLTRSIVHLAENWLCSNDYAGRKLGYAPKKDWRAAIREALAELRPKGYPWPRLAQAT
jgi:nucleoside-diphosphate-sugar epimerase